MRHLLFAVALMLALAGCGNKGALYLPAEPVAEPTPASAEPAETPAP